LAGESSNGMLLLILFLSIPALVAPTDAAQALQADLGLSLFAQQDGRMVQEVAPDSSFDYILSVKNNDMLDPTQDAVLTVKLPYNAIYVDAVVDPLNLTDYSLRKDGDLLVVTFGSFFPLSLRQVNITMIAPGDAPDSLYIIATLMHLSDPFLDNNSATLSTYVPLNEYDRIAATKSLEDMLHNQSYLLFTFQYFLMDLPRGPEENYSFTVSFEQLLRSQACLTDRFQELLANDSRRGWNYDIGSEDRTYLLRSYEALLREEADLFAGFESKINESWSSLDGYVAQKHSMDAQWELLASLEDLLKKQIRLYKGFVFLFHEIDQSAPTQERRALVEFLASLEDLLRRESNLLMSFEHTMGRKFSQMGSNSGEEYYRVQPPLGTDWSIPL